MGTKGRQGNKKRLLNQVRYAVSGKSIKAIKDDFLAATLPVKRRAIIEGVQAFYYDLQKKPLSQNNVHRIYELQELLNEMQNGQLLASSKTAPQRDHTINPAKQPAASLAGSKTVPTNSEKLLVPSSFQSAIQFSSATKSDVCDVVVGIDFGTACTKVVIRTPFHHNRAFIVPFGKYGHESCEYLLPTHVSIKNNIYYIPKSIEEPSRTDLKMRLISSLQTDSNDTGSIDDAIAYLALVIRFVRTWFLREQFKVYGDFDLAWQINIGIPSATAEDDNICHLYHQVLASAWALSTIKGKITHHRLLEVREAIHLDRIPEEDIPPIEIFPEIAAQVTGYTQSDLRREGLHLLIDIGAGTLDICGFNVVRIDNENRLPLFSTSVEPNGVKNLHCTRIKAINDTLAKQYRKLMPDATTHLAEIGLYSPDQFVCMHSVEVSENAFYAECRKQLFKLATHLKKIHPSAEEWKSQFRVFICGGGSLIPFYRALVDDFSEWLKQNYDNRGAQLVLFPKQEKIHGDILDSDYHRFGVAVGLSHYSADFDRVMTNIEPVVSEIEAQSNEPWFMQREYAYLVDY